MAAWEFWNNLFDLRRDRLRSILGAGKHRIVDLSGGTVTCAVPSNNESTPMQGCRYFEVDTEGFIRFDYTDDQGNTNTRVMVAKKGINHYPNITRVYDTYNGVDACTCGVYTDAGGSVTGIALIY